MRKALQAE